jgi:hypothetical protein
MHGHVERSGKPDSAFRAGEFNARDCCWSWSAMHKKPHLSCEFVALCACAAPLPSAPFFAFFVTLPQHTLSRHIPPRCPRLPPPLCPTTA